MDVDDVPNSGDELAVESLLSPQAEDGTLAFLARFKD